MKNNTVKKALLISLLISPLCVGSLSAQPHGSQKPSPAKPQGHSGPQSPRFGAYVGVQPPSGSVEIMVGNFSFSYNSGVFYKNTKHGYVVAPAPRGAIIKTLPPGYSRVVIGGYVYYCDNNVYYRQAPNGYIVVETPAMVASTRVVASAPNAVTAPVLSELSVWQGEQELLLRDGAFFRNTPEGLVWVELPVGALTAAIPSDATSIWYQEIEYHDVDGVLFRKTPDGYKVVAAPWQ